MINKVFIFVLIIFIMSGCSQGLHDDYINEKTWMYDSGFNINNFDFAHFKEDSTLEVIDGIIYKNGEPNSEVIDLNKEANELKIRKFESDSIGLYINIIEFSS